MLRKQKTYRWSNLWNITQSYGPVKNMIFIKFSVAWSFWKSLIYMLLYWRVKVVNTLLINEQANQTVRASECSNILHQSGLHWHVYVLKHNRVTIVWDNSYVYEMGVVNRFTRLPFFAWQLIVQVTLNCTLFIEIPVYYYSCRQKQKLFTFLLTFMKAGISFFNLPAGALSLQFYEIHANTRRAWIA